jgi:ATP-dependent RNA helicase RhlE
MTFKELNIIEPILGALQEKGYTEPTPIQEQAIPIILTKRDLLGCAQTGTGKTAAFAIPIIQLIENEIGGLKQKPILRSLIVTPTRELAIQIDENIAEYSKNTSIKHTVIYGGVKQGKQVDKVQRGVHILTVTPGRLLDLVDQGFVNLSTIQILVLDEADRMLDMGFINDIRRILKLVPKERQTLFFSATMPDNIVELSKSILTNPKSVSVSPPSSTAEKIQQFLYYTNVAHKADLLEHIIRERNMDQVLIFCRTKRGADKVAKNLNDVRIKSAAIHGDKAQLHRQKVLNQFKDGDIKVLVATDIAARGIDIDKLKYVINYNVPNIPESYVHRIGRSGRAGEEGTAITISEPEDNAFVYDVQKLIGIEIPEVVDHPYPQTDFPMSEGEKKLFEREKNKKKMEFIALKRAQGGGRGGNKPQKQAKPISTTVVGSTDSSSQNSGPGQEGQGKKKRNKKKKSNFNNENGNASPAQSNDQGSNSNNEQRPPREHRPKKVLIRNQGENNNAGSESNEGLSQVPQNNSNIKSRPNSNKVNNSNNNRNKGKSGPRSTEMSEELKSKFMFRLEK